MDRKKIFFLLWAIALTTLIGFNVKVVTAKLKPISLEELTDGADFILIGAVTNIQSLMVGEDIVTDMTVLVEQNIKDNIGAGAITVRKKGGTVGDDTLGVEDEARFARSQRVLLFLKMSGGVFEVFGRSLGKFTLENNQVLENGISETDFIDQIKAIVALP
jgi:hypothetical protein